MNSCQSFDCRTSCLHGTDKLTDFRQNSSSSVPDRIKFGTLTTTPMNRTKFRAGDCAGSKKGGGIGSILWAEIESPI